MSPEHDPATLRQRLYALDDPAFDAFCQDYYLVVYEFARGLRKGEKITLCEGCIQIIRRLFMSVVMKRIYWSLSNETYATYEDFVTAVTEYNQVIDPEGNEWNPDQIVSAKPIQVVYEALWKNEDDTIDLSIGTPGIPVTMGQVLFTLNNATCDFFRGADTHFFEGLVLVNDTTYELIVGS